MRRAQKSGSGRAGYTLVELMMVVAIIAASTIAFAPGIGRAVADRRVSSATRELIRIGRRARSDSFGYLRAHLIWIVPASGRVMLLRGPNNSCLLPTWSTIAADCPSTAAGVPGPRCLEQVFLSSIGGPTPIAMNEETLSGAGVAAYSSVPHALCYASSGVVYQAAGSDLTVATAALSDLNNVNGGVVYTLHTGISTSTPVSTDRVHRILFPLGSSARALR
jgi:prepilin-type N-terminal cleavage/methylation domain-containing protein